MKNTFVASVSHITVMVAALFMLSACTFAQDFTVHMKDQDGKTATHYVSRTAVRDVASSPVETDVIYRIDKGTIIRLNNQNKTYTELTLAEAKQQADKKAAGMSPMQQQMMAHMAGNGTPAITKLGAGEAIAGYPTEKYSIKMGMMQIQSWITPALQLPAGYTDMVAASAGIAGAGFGQIIKAMNNGQIKGYLLKSVGTSTMMQGMTQTNTAISVDKGQIPVSTFEPPAGYKRVSAN